MRMTLERRGQIVPSVGKVVSLSVVYCSAHCRGEKHGAM